MSPTSLAWVIFAYNEEYRLKCVIKAEAISAPAFLISSINVQADKGVHIPPLPVCQSPHSPTNTAFTLRFLSIGTMHTPVPGQRLAGLQPRKTEPASGETDKVTYSA